MKTLLITLLLLLLATPLLAADYNVNVAWDNPTSQAWNNVRIYEKVGASYAMKVEVAGSALTATITNVQPGNHTYIARSYMNSVESVDSNTASKEIQPDLPGNFRIAVLEVEVDDNGTVTIKSVKLVDPSQFFRIG